MTRFAPILALFATVALVVADPSPDPAAPPALQGPVSSNVCAQYTNGEGPALVCAPLFAVTGALYYQSSSVSGNTLKALGTIKDTIFAQDALAQLVPLTVGGGLVGNLAYSLGGALAGVASLLQNATPQCKCDLSACYNALYAAAQGSQFTNAAGQTACSQAEFACAPFYSRENINQVAPGCSKYPTTRRTRRSDHNVLF